MMMILEPRAMLMDRLHKMYILSFPRFISHKMDPVMGRRMMVMMVMMMMMRSRMMILHASY